MSRLPGFKIVSFGLAFVISATLIVFLIQKPALCALTRNATSLILNQHLSDDVMLSDSQKINRSLMQFIELCQTPRVNSFLGRLYLMNDEFVKAQGAFESALSVTKNDARLFIWRANSLTNQGKTYEAIDSLFEALDLEPLNEIATNQLSLIYGQIGWSASDDPSNNNSIEESKGSNYIDLNLRLRADKPRWLRVVSDSKFSADTIVKIDGIDYEEVHTIIENGSYVRRYLIPKEKSDPVSIRIENIEVVGSLKTVTLEYISNAESYSSITDAEWTKHSFMTVLPGGKYQTLLFDISPDDRLLMVNIFDHRDRYLDIMIDGKLAGTFVGGEWSPERPGGPTTFLYPIPDDSGNLINISLSSPQKTQGGTAIRYISLVSESQTPY